MYIRINSMIYKEIDMDNIEEGIFEELYSGERGEPRERRERCNSRDKEFAKFLLSSGTNKDSNYDSLEGLSSEE